MPEQKKRESGSQEGLSLIGWASERTEKELSAFFGRKGGLHLTPGLHITLFAHAGRWPSGARECDVLALAPKTLEAELAGLQLWRRPQVDGAHWTLFAQDFLISPLISNDAERAHERVKSLGFSHCYGAFIAHLTLARSSQTLNVSSQFLEEYGRFIARQKLVASFDRWEVRPMQTPSHLRAIPTAGHPSVAAHAQGTLEAMPESSAIALAALAAKPARRAQACAEGLIDPPHRVCAPAQRSAAKA